jgi:hypothetical protein
VLVFGLAKGGEQHSTLVLSLTLASLCSVDLVFLVLGSPFVSSLLRLGRGCLLTGFVRLVCGTWLLANGHCLFALCGVPQ